MMVLTNSSPINNGPTCELDLFPGVTPQPEKPTCSVCGIETDDIDAPDPQTAPDSLQLTMTWIGEGTADPIDKGTVFIYGPNNAFAWFELDAATRAELNANPPASIVKVFFDVGFEPTRALLELEYSFGSVEESRLQLL